MSCEYNVHHDVNELMKLLEVEENVQEGITADAFTERLLKSSEQKSKTRGAAATFFRKLETHSDHDFKHKYNQLKVQNVMELDPLVHLLARVYDDQKIRCMLNFQSKKSNRASNHIDTDSNQSVDSLQRTGSSNSITSNDFDASKLLDEELGKVLKHEKEKHTSKKRDPNRRSNIKLEDWKFLSLDYQLCDWSKEIPIQPLKTLTVPEQENALIEDLLYVLVGVEGKYIRLQPLEEKPNKHNIVIDNTGDELLRTLTTRITALCPYYSQTIHFIDEIDYGLVNQSLAAAMREHIKDYFMLISQLETQNRKGELSLQKMWYYLQPCFTNLEILKHIANNVKKGNISGGAVLTILHEKTLALTGNPKAQEFCLSVTRKACEPYFEILDKWIYEGIIDDPYKEFFVEERDVERDDEMKDDDLYWENRYVVIRNRIPVFLERHFEMILKTGKYLSVIRQCGRKLSQTYSPQFFVYTIEERVYVEIIEAAYKYASKELLRLLVDESDLIGRLTSIKHYFFMDQGDFIVQFMDLASDELEKEIDDIAPNRLDSLLELSLRTTLLNCDPYKDDVGIELLPHSLLTQMSKILTIGSDFPDDETNETITSLKGFEALALKFNVVWPLSLILNRRSITCYQMLFRHLFYCKYVERQLEDVWKGNKMAKGYTLNAVTGYAQAFALRQKMLNFVQNLEYYIMVEVIEPSFHHFLELVQTNVTSVDDMIRHHGDYIEKCLRDGMLTIGDLLQSVMKLLRLCINFSKFMKDSNCYATQYELLDSSENITKEFECIDSAELNPNNVCENGNSINFETSVTSMHEEFNSTLHQLLEAITLQSNESYTMLPVLYRLDFNGFYSR